MAKTTSKNPLTFVVEHLDPELGPWSALEYDCIAQESKVTQTRFLLTSVPEALKLPGYLAQVDSLEVEHRSVEEIFSDRKSKVCLLDPAARVELSPVDGEQFEIFLFGGILGDDPPRDRTSELRKKGYERRRLGPKQMTTDTAVRVTRMIVQDRIPLENVPYADDPEIRINDHESTQMPFRYVVNQDGQPIMPRGMIELIGRDADKSVSDLF